MVSSSSYLHLLFLPLKNLLQFRHLLGVTTAPQAEVRHLLEEQEEEQEEQQGEEEEQEDEQEEGEEEQEEERSRRRSRGMSRRRERRRRERRRSRRRRGGGAGRAYRGSAHFFNSFFLFFYFIYFIDPQGEVSSLHGPLLRHEGAAAAVKQLGLQCLAQGHFHLLLMGRAGIEPTTLTPDPLSYSRISHNM